MKKQIKCLTTCALVSAIFMLASCGGESVTSQAAQTSAAQTTLVQSTTVQATAAQMTAATTTATTAVQTTADQSTADLYVRFGDSGETFALHLYDNETAAAIAKHVGTAEWRLPIYHYDDFENWEVMQYYDIPRRYEIPNNAERITSERAGTVYYSEPNRIILFYQDAEVAGDYTPVGYFDCTEEFVTAVEENPVLAGWGNKIVCISADE